MTNIIFYGDPSPIAGARPRRFKRCEGYFLVKIDVTSYQGNSTLVRFHLRDGSFSTAKYYGDCGLIEGECYLIELRRREEYISHESSDTEVYWVIVEVAANVTRKLWLDRRQEDTILTRMDPNWEKKKMPTDPWG